MTMTTGPISPADEGTIEISPEGRAVLRFERHLDHPIDRVWAAVSTPEQMEAWLAFKVRLEPDVGGTISLWLGDSRSESPIFAGRVTVFDPPRVLEAEMDDGTLLRIEVTERTGGGCTLVFTDTRPEGERGSNSVLAGWHLRMDLIGPGLDGTPADWTDIDSRRDEHGLVADIAELYWHYRNKPRG